MPNAAPRHRAPGWRPKQAWGKDRWQVQPGQELPKNWPALRKWVLLRDAYCKVCEANGHVTPAVQVDHIRPRHLGGTDDVTNLQGICRACHARKTAGEGGPVRRRSA